MKAYVVMVVVVLCGCTCNNKRQPADEQNGPTVTINKVDYTQRLTAFNNYIKQQDSAVVLSVRLATDRYRALFTGADSAVADSALVLFYHFHQRVNDHVNTSLVKDTTNYHIYLQDSTLMNANPRVKQTFQTLTSNGFRLSVAEGSVYASIDYNYYLQHFQPYVSVAMQAYFQQQLQEQKAGYMSDGSLLITPTELAERILFWESFLQQHPSFSFNGAIKERQREYTTFLLEGVDNTPLFIGRNQLSPRYDEAYKQILTANPGSRLAAVVKPYYAALSSGNKQLQQQLISRYEQEGIVLDFSE